MLVKVIAFGQISEITGRQFTIDATDTEELNLLLKTKYTELAEKKYAIAVNKKIISGIAKLTENDEVALMPPYSGG